MLIDEFLIALGVKADTKKLQDFEKGLDGVSDSAEKTESSMLKAYDATDSFVAGVGKAMGIITFFTGVLGGALGVFHGTIMSLQELIDEEKLLTKVTKDQIDQQKQYKESVETMGKRFQSLKVELAFGFLPTMQKTIDSLDNFLKANKDAIVNGITVFLNAIKSTLGVIGNFIRFIDKIVTNTVGWKNALLILVGVLAIVKKATIAAFIANPIAWIMAAIAGLLLLIDDFMTYLDGGESQFGEFWGSMLKWIEVVMPYIKGIGELLKNAFDSAMPYIKAVFSFVVGVVQKWWALFSGLFEFFASLWSGNTDGAVNALSKIWDAVTGLVGDMFTAFSNVLPLIFSLFKGIFSLIGTFLKTTLDGWILIFKGLVNGIGNALSVVFDLVTMPFKEAFDWVSNKWQGLKNMFSSGVSANVNMGDGVGGRSITTNSNRVVNNNITNNGSFNINGASNPNVTANAVGANWNSITQKNLGGMAKA